jgi:hypothetical protein
MNKEGGLNEEEEKNDFIFANEEQKEEEKKDYSLNDEDRARMEQVRAMHGPIPDNIIEQKLIKKYPQLLHPFMYMFIRLFVAVLTVFAQSQTSIQVVLGYVVIALL